MTLQGAADFGAHPGVRAAATHIDLAGARPRPNRVSETAHEKFHTRRPAAPEAFAKTLI